MTMLHRNHLAALFGCVMAVGLLALHSAKGADRLPSQSSAAVSRHLSTLHAATRTDQPTTSNSARTAVTRTHPSGTATRHGLSAESLRSRTSGHTITGQMRLPPRDAQALPNTITLLIGSFCEYDPDSTSRMMMGSGSPPTSATINMGDEITLQWRIHAKNVSNVRANISGVGNVPVGTARENSDGTTSYINRYTFRPATGCHFTLTVTGNAEANGRSFVVRREKRFTVHVRRPELVLATPEFHQEDRSVRVFVRNTGQVDLPACPLTIWYWVQRASSYTTFIEETITTGPVGIDRGERVQVGEIRLPETALSYSRIRVRLNVSTSQHGGLETGGQSFIHSWRTDTLRISPVLLEAMVGSLVGQVRLNNYSGAGGDEQTTLPVVANDSFIDLMGSRHTFTPDVISLRYSITGRYSGRTYYELLYRGLLNNITASGRTELLTPGANRIGGRLRFDVSRSSDVKGYRYVDSHFDDSEAPDINFERLNIDILLPLNVRHGRMTFSEVEVSPDISCRLEGRGWELLNWRSVRENLNSSVRNTVVGLVRQQVATDSRRAAIEASINDTVRGIPRSLPVTYITEASVDTADGLVITYR